MDTVLYACDGTQGVVLQDFHHDSNEINEIEVREYAEFLGIDPIAEPALVAIARAQLHAPLPPNWRLVEPDEGQSYFFNYHTGQSSWEDPRDLHTLQLVQAARESASTSTSARRRRNAPFDVTSSFSATESASLPSFTATTTAKPVTSTTFSPSFAALRKGAVDAADPAAGPSDPSPTKASDSAVITPVTASSTAALPDSTHSKTQQDSTHSKTQQDSTHSKTQRDSTHSTRALPATHSDGPGAKGCDRPAMSADSVDEKAVAAIAPPPIAETGIVELAQVKSPSRADADAAGCNAAGAASVEEERNRSNAAGAASVEEERNRSNAAGAYLLESRCAESAYRAAASRLAAASASIHDAAHRTSEESKAAMEAARYSITSLRGALSAAASEAQAQAAAAAACRSDLAAAVQDASSEVTQHLVHRMQNVEVTLSSLSDKASEGIADHVLRAAEHVIAQISSGIESEGQKTAHTLRLASTATGAELMAIKNVTAEIGREMQDSIEGAKQASTALRSSSSILAAHAAQLAAEAQCSADDAVAVYSAALRSALRSSCSSLAADIATSVRVALNPVLEGFASLQQPVLRAIEPPNVIPQKTKDSSSKPPRSSSSAVGGANPTDGTLKNAAQQKHRRPLGGRSRFPGQMSFDGKTSEELLSLKNNLANSALELKSLRASIRNRVHSMQVARMQWKSDAEIARARLREAQSCVADVTSHAHLRGCDNVNIVSEAEAALLAARADVSFLKGVREELDRHAVALNRDITTIEEGSKALVRMTKSLKTELARREGRAMDSTDGETTASECDGDYLSEDDLEIDSTACRNPKRSSEISVVPNEAEILIRPNAVFASRLPVQTKYVSPPKISKYIASVPIAPTYSPPHRAPLQASMPSLPAPNHVPFRFRQRNFAFDRSVQTVERAADAVNHMLTKIRSHQFCNLPPHPYPRTFDAHNAYATSSIPAASSTGSLPLSTRIQCENWLHTVDPHSAC